MAWVTLGNASPVAGGLGKYIKLDGQSKGRIKEPILFKGGERACVILIGDHDPSVPLAVSIYDEENNLVVRDDPGIDFCAAIWYPPRDGHYYIEVENRGVQWNKCWIAVK
jgi:hypothetical protein